MNPARPSTHPPRDASPNEGPSRGPLAEAFTGREFLLPPPPADGEIPDWHLATGVKPLRPLPRDLAETVRHQSRRPANNNAHARTWGRTERLSGRTRRRSTGHWGRRVTLALLGAIVVGALVGAVVEHLIRTARLPY